MTKTTKPEAAITALREGQFQVDEDGTMVGVSRQALHEVLQWIEGLDHDN